jgi:hypothetical protein
VLLPTTVAARPRPRSRSRAVGSGTQAQRDAADRLVEILLPHAYLEALYVIEAELERQGKSNVSDAVMEKAAATRGIALIDAGKWEQRDAWVHLPPSWIRQILEMFIGGEQSPLGPPPTRQRQKTKRSKARASRTPSPR